MKIAQEKETKLITKPINQLMYQKSEKLFRKKKKKWKVIRFYLVGLSERFAVGNVLLRKHLKLHEMVRIFFYVWDLFSLGLKSKISHGRNKKFCFCLGVAFITTNIWTELSKLDLRQERDRDRKANAKCKKTISTKAEINGNPFFFVSRAEKISRV